MEGDEARLDQDGEVHRGDVAVADEGLRDWRGSRRSRGGSESGMNRSRRAGQKMPFTSGSAKSGVDVGRAFLVAAGKIACPA